MIRIMRIKNREWVIVQGKDKWEKDNWTTEWQKVPESGDKVNTGKKGNDKMRVQKGSADQSPVSL